MLAGLFIKRARWARELMPMCSIRWTIVTTRTDVAHKAAGCVWTEVARRTYKTRALASFIAISSSRARDGGNGAFRAIMRNGADTSDTFERLS